MIFEFLSAQLAELRRKDLFRHRMVVDGAQGPHVLVDGREVLTFCSNDYLGLANHLRVVEAVVEAAWRYGVGAGASHLLAGHNAIHTRVEERLAAFVGMPRALLFATGYQANMGAITALAGREDAIFSDELNHASLIDGTRLSRAQVAIYPHVDLQALESALAASRARSRLVVTDAVFSMDGDIAPLPAILDLCERYDACLLVDDAHGFGVLGAGGRGALEHFGLRSPRIVYVGTLGKAAGVSGAFVAAQSEVVETLLQRARTYIYTTASPPLLAAAVEASLLVMQEEGWRRDRLRRLIRQLKSQWSELGAPSSRSDTAIQPLVLGGNAAALAASAKLRERGILVPAIRPPTVPEGTARLRISLSAAHGDDDLKRLVAALRDAVAADLTA
jgi:8-amino-7-oxononanoate synthase